MSRIIFAVLLAAVLIQTTVAEEFDGKDRIYHIGMRSAILLGSMDLSKIDGDFDSLDSNGFTGPHHSGVFLAYDLNAHLRVGFETLAGNSDLKARTTMYFNCAGPVVELRYGGKVNMHGGLHAGAVIADAMTRQGVDEENGVREGKHYKSAGYFAAPYLGIGINSGSREISIFVKHTNFFAGGDFYALDAFDASYVGLGLSWRL